MAPTPKVQLIKAINAELVDRFDKAQVATGRGGHVLVYHKSFGKALAMPNAYASKLSTKWSALLEKNHGHLSATQTIPEEMSNNAAKFVVHWMMSGGMDSATADSVPYPKSYTVGLFSLQKLVEYLGLTFLHGRIDSDLKAIKKAQDDYASMNAEHSKKEEVAAKKAAEEAPGCGNCWGPQHRTPQCPCPSCNKNGPGWWTHRSANTESLEGATVMAQSDAPVTSVNQVVTKTRDGLIIHDQIMKRWIIPVPTMEITNVRIGEDGQLKWDCAAPFDYYWLENPNYKK